MKRIRYFTSKNAIKHERRFVLVVLPLLWIALLAFPNLPIAVASEADAESTSSLELVETQTVSFATASTLSPAAPFSMIIMNDPQFPWPQDSAYWKQALEEQWHKVKAIRAIWDINDDSGDAIREWPSKRAQNDKFDRWSTPVPQVKGVIINGDLTYSSFLADTPWTMSGWWAIPRWHSVFPYSRAEFYRNYYVDYLDYFCPGLSVYAGYGNHDSKWTYYDLACALLLEEDTYDWAKRRLWKNFPPASTLYDVDFDLVHVTWGEYYQGSLAYSWEIGNYHFVQINTGDPVVAPQCIPLYNDWDGSPYWLNNMVIDDAWDWLRWDLADATGRGMKIVINKHYQSEIDDIIEDTNTVAVFTGHSQWLTGMHELSDTLNLFKQRIPYFNSGHSGYSPDDRNDNQFLIVECADDYMNVGQVRVGDWNLKEGHVCGVPSWSPSWADWSANPNFTRTVKWNNEAPYVTDLKTKGTVFAGELAAVATGDFTDDPCLWDSWTVEVNYGDGTSVEIFNEGPDWGQRYPFVLNHTYGDGGEYEISVTVTDDWGAKNRATCTINVVPALSGFVIDEYHNKPLAGVTITCDGKTTTTDAGGYYEFTPLDPGGYSVNMTIPLGYNSIVPDKTATITAGQATIVNFAAYPLPDIIFTKATVDTERLAGDTITYHITVNNQGDGPATNIVITDALPSMTTFISSNASATANGQTETWSIGTMNEHTTKTIELTVRISLLVYPDTILTNNVTVDFDDWKELPQTSENASATTSIVPTVPTENVQGIGYWRRQIKAVQDGKSCDYTESELYLLFEKIRVSSQIYNFYYSLENVSDIILAQPTGKDTLETRAEQQLFILWLNLAAHAVAPDTPVDLADLTTATTIIEAITQCEAILLDPTHTKATCECSKDICDQLNNCVGLPW